MTVLQLPAPVGPRSRAHDEALVIIDWEKRRLQVARSHVRRLTEELDLQERELDQRRARLVTLAGGEQKVLVGWGAYHKAGCGWIPKEAKEMTRGQAISKGHPPCSSHYCFRGEPA
jgi:hypothetical protein